MQKEFHGRMDGQKTNGQNNKHSWGEGGWEAPKLYYDLFFFEKLWRPLVEKKKKKITCCQLLPLVIRLLSKLLSCKY